MQESSAHCRTVPYAPGPTLAAICDSDTAATPGDAEICCQSRLLASRNTRVDTVPGDTRRDITASEPPACAADGQATHSEAAISAVKTQTRRTISEAPPRPCKPGATTPAQARISGPDL